MIEVIYRKENEEKSRKDRFKLPKNIRQIGGGESDIQVYMEDSVYLYLQKIPDEPENIRYGVLLGKVRQSCGYSYIFIEAAVDVREIMNNTVIFSNDVWTGINDDIEDYFKEKQVVGWFLSEPYNNSGQSMWIKKTHVNHFAGNDKVFFLVDREEDEENFYYYKNNKMDRLPCYHIYYEKNERMINYVELSGMNMRFKKKEKNKLEDIFESQLAENTRNIIREEREKNGTRHRGMKENTEVKENGVDDVTETEPLGNMSKQKKINYGAFLSKAASVMVVGALAFTLVTMGSEGAFDSISKNLKGIIGNIINDENTKGDESGIISVLGTDIKAEPGTEINSHNEEMTSEQETGNNNDEEMTSEIPTENQEEENNNEDKYNKVEEQSTINEEKTTVKTEENEEATEENDAVSAITPASPTMYTVQEGDTLYKICKRLYGSVDNMSVIMELNAIDNADEITEGENLIVP